MRNGTRPSAASSGTRPATSSSTDHDHDARRLQAADGGPADHRERARHRGRGQFRLELAGAEPGHRADRQRLDRRSARSASIALIDSGFRINAQGLVARVQLELDADGFGAGIGLKFSARARCSRSTRRAGRRHSASSTVAPGFLLRHRGHVEFLGFVKGSGFVEIAISSTGFQLLRCRLQLRAHGGLQVPADGGAAVVSGPRPRHRAEAQRSASTPTPAIFRSRPAARSSSTRPT